MKTLSIINENLSKVGDRYAYYFNDVTFDLIYDFTLSISI